MEDILNALKRDEKKFLRMPYILTMNNEISKANKKFKEAVKYGDEESRKIMKHS